MVAWCTYFEPLGIQQNERVALSVAVEVFEEFVSSHTSFDLSIITMLVRYIAFQTMEQYYVLSVFSSSLLFINSILIGASVFFPSLNSIVHFCHLEIFFNQIINSCYCLVFKFIVFLSNFDFKVSGHQAYVLDIKLSLWSINEMIGIIWMSGSLGIIIMVWLH